MLEQKRQIGIEAKFEEFGILFNRMLPSLHNILPRFNLMLLFVLETKNLIWIFFVSSSKIGYGWNFIILYFFNAVGPNYSQITFLERWNVFQPFFLLYSKHFGIILTINEKSPFYDSYKQMMLIKSAIIFVGTICHWGNPSRWYEWMGE